MRAISLAIVGIDHPNKRGPGRRFDLLQCTPGDPVELRPEPSNKFDEHAIAVFSARGIQLGYLPSERAVWLGLLMRRGHDVTAIFQGLGETVAWCRVAFDGEAPALPAAREPQPGEGDGFWPDPMYDDE